MMALPEDRPGDLIDRFTGCRIAVIGDVMLDHFLFGRVDRISPEAPVPVVRYERDEFRLGGAGNVAHNVRALGGQAALVALVGRDEAANRLRANLAQAGIDHAGLVEDPGRPTTRKVRVVTSRNQQVARLDYEGDDEPDAAIVAGLLDAATASVDAARAIVLSDYRKGVVFAGLVSAVVERARARGVPVLVDPKVPQPDRYRGATVVTPNRDEAERMTQMSIRTPADAKAAARALHERSGASVLITLGEHGMWVLDTSAASPVEAALPAVAREVADVTGAGDTVIATLALGLAAGASLLDAARLANLAAGLVVARFGPVAVGAGELRAASRHAGG
jgi:D-beta-D-heptose 7-phosphate kinase/D-beta-D-heptose 1-phosphate adenosyltransferase